MMLPADVPDRDSPEYESYLSDKIVEEERRLKLLQDKCRVTEMEQQLADLCLRSAKYENAGKRGP